MKLPHAFGVRHTIARAWPARGCIYAPFARNAPFYPSFQSSTIGDCFFRVWLCVVCSAPRKPLAKGLNLVCRKRQFLYKRVRLKGMCTLTARNFFNEVFPIAYIQLFNVKAFATFGFILYARLAGRTRTKWRPAFFDIRPLSTLAIVQF